MNSVTAPSSGKKRYRKMILRYVRGTKAHKAWGLGVGGGSIALRTILSFRLPETVFLVFIMHKAKNT